MEELYLHQVTRALGRVRIPGSKSITNRALLLAALSEGATLLTGVLESEDTTVMMDALSALGVGVDKLDTPGRVRVTGVGKGAGFPVKAAEIFILGVKIAHILEVIADAPVSPRSFELFYGFERTRNIGP